MPVQPPDQLTAIVLAGGRGRRMGMQNKGLLTFHGQPLVAQVITRLQAQVSRIVISANDRLTAYQQFGYAVIPDQTTGYAGPLAGIHAVMCQQASEWYITAPCDMPYLPLDYVTRMLAAREGVTACVAHDGQRQQSGCCLVHQSLLPALEYSLQHQHFAVHRWLNDMGATLVDFSDTTEGFCNINTPDELQQLALTTQKGSSGYD